MSNEKEFEQINDNDNDIVIPKKPHYPPTIKPQDLLPKNSNSNGKPSRIPNAFIAYRIAFCQGLKSQNICITMPDVSSLASDFWAREPIYVKATYKKIANEAKLLYDKQSSSNDNNNNDDNDNDELKEVKFKESKKSKKLSSVVVETKNENMEFTTTTTTIDTTATGLTENLNSEPISFSSQNIYPQHIQESNFHNYAYNNNYINYNDYNNNYNYSDYNDYNNNNTYYNNDDYNNYYNYVYDNQISQDVECLDDPFDSGFQKLHFVAYPIV